MPGIRIPTTTYRLQFNPHFQFFEAQAWIPYLHRLGISDIYSSPIFKALPGSAHGYDVTDPTQINPELGTPAELESLVKEIQDHHLGLLLDIVPNHMAASSAHPFWMDFLENGLHSRYAYFFNVDWSPCDSQEKNRIILPILGKPYGQALEDQEISLVLDDSHLVIRYYDTRLPVSLKSYTLVLSYRLNSFEKRPGASGHAAHELKRIIADMERLPPPENEPGARDHSLDRIKIQQNINKLINSSGDIRHFIQENILLFNGERGNTRSFDILDNLLDQQIYRLAFWRTGREELNFRRFFDINSLVGVRVELPEVMEATHALVYRMISEDKIDGLRIDHIDGLHDPWAYLESLQDKLGQFYIVVEKILSGNETLPDNWPVSGTTGYDFAREVNDIFIDAPGLEKLDVHYSRMISNNTHFADTVWEKKSWLSGIYFQVKPAPWDVS